MINDELVISRKAMRHALTIRKGLFIDMFSREVITAVSIFMKNTLAASREGHPIVEIPKYIYTTPFIYVDVLAKCTTLIEKNLHLSPLLGVWLEFYADYNNEITDVDRKFICWLCKEINLLRKGSKESVITDLYRSGRPHFDLGIDLYWYFFAAHFINESSLTRWDITQLSVRKEHIELTPIFEEALRLREIK